MTSKIVNPLGAGLLFLSFACSSFGHGLIQDPPSRNWFCGAVTKPDHVLNGVAQYPACGGAFASDFSGGYSFMSVLTHTEGRSVVRPLPQNVCGFNSETWQGRSTPWDQPIDWPTTNMSAGPRTFSWNISWGAHFSDTKEFRYWITKPDFQFQVGKPLAWSDFEDQPFCTLEYNDSSPNANPNVVPDKAGAMFHTKCTVPQRAGRHVIYGEWGRNQWTFERFHSCVDVVFAGGGSGGETPGFTLSGPSTRLSVPRGASAASTVSIARTGGFTGPVAFSASGLPAGVTAAFNPASATGGSTTFTLTASGTASTGAATVTVTGTNGALLRTAPVQIDVVPQSDFSLSAAPASVTVQQGATVTSTVNISRTGGFSGAINFSASGLPSGVTASFSPSPSTGAATTLTLTASGTAATGSRTVTVNGTSGSITRSASINVAVNGTSSGTFSLSVAPASLSLSQGGSATATINLARNGFTGPVAFTASELPAGVTASFDPASASGSSATLRLAASSGAITGAGTMIVTGTGGGISRTLTVPFTITAAGTPGGVTVSSVVNVNQPWYNEVAVRVNNTAPITALSVTITVQRTTGVSFAGQYNTVGGQIQQSNSSTGGAITYRYTLLPGQTLSAGGHRIFAAQASGSGVAHPTAGDTYTVTYTMGGTSLTQSGHF